MSDMVDLLPTTPAAVERALETAADAEQARERLSLILEATPELVSFADARANVLYINQAGRRMLGLGPEEDVTRLHASDLHPEWALARLILKAVPVLLRDGVWRGDSAYVARNGREIPVWQTILCHRGRDGAVDFLSTIAMDISDRKAAEGHQQLLIEATRLLGTTLDDETGPSKLVRFVVPRFADNCFVTLLDARGQLTEVAVAHADPVLEQRLLGGLHHPHPFQPRTPVGPHKVLRTGEPELVPDVTEIWLDFAYHDPEGRKLASEVAPRSVLLVPLRSRGRTFGLITFVMAASGRRFGPADFTLGQELGRRLALALDNARLYQTAQHAIHARDDVLGIVAHDLRSPLNAITTSASVLLRRPAEDEQLRRHLGLIQRSSQQMERLIQDLLDVTRLEAGNLVLEQRSEDVAALVKEASEMFDDAAREKQLRLECHVEEDVPAVYVDRFRVLQALSNLLGNALKFTPAGGSVTLRAARDGPDVRFSVSDTGPGIPEEQRAHVFDRFWQARETARAGAGLGLSIARGVVEAHGGRIWVDSRPGVGSTFSFTLPVASHEHMH